MSITIAVETPPLAADADGVIRIGATRITLDTVVIAFRQGASAESIADQYPALTLAEVYSTIGYFLRHADELEAYLRRRDEEAQAVRVENERRWPNAGIRERLQSRSRS